MKEEGSCGGRRGKEGVSQHEAAAWGKDVTRRSEAEDEDMLTIKSPTKDVLRVASDY